MKPKTKNLMVGFVLGVAFCVLVYFIQPPAILSFLENIGSMIWSILGVTWLLGAFLEIVHCWVIGMIGIVQDAWAMFIKNPFLTYFVGCGIGLNLYWLGKVVKYLFPKHAERMLESKWSMVLAVSPAIILPTIIGADARGVTDMLPIWAGTLAAQGALIYLVSKAPAIYDYLSNRKQSVA